MNPKDIARKITDDPDVLNEEWEDIGIEDPDIGSDYVQPFEITIKIGSNKILDENDNVALVLKQPFEFNDIELVEKEIFKRFDRVYLASSIDRNNETVTFMCARYAIEEIFPAHMMVIGTHEIMRGSRILPVNSIDDAIKMTMKIYEVSREGIIGIEETPEHFIITIKYPAYSFMQDLEEMIEGRQMSREKAVEDINELVANQKIKRVMNRFVDSVFSAMGL